MPPPGVAFVTVTLTGPRVATSLAGTATVSVVPPPPTVPPVIGWLPKFTVEPEMKPEPVNTKEETARPTVPEAGETLVSVGAGFFTANAEFAEVADVPPFGAGFVTVTLMFAAEAMYVAGICT